MTYTLHDMLPRPSKDSESGLLNGELAGDNSGRGVSSPPCVSVAGGTELLVESENVSASKGNVSRNQHSFSTFQSRISS